MYGRPTILFPLALLALLALLTLWIDRSVQMPEQKAPGIDRHDPDYFMNNFVTSKTDMNGSLKYMLAAVSMTHYPDDDSTTLERPRFTQYGVDKPSTQIEGQRGLISSNGETVEFMDNVRVIRQAFQDRGEMVVLTEYMKIYPKKDLATTDRPVVITQAPKTVIHATGMIYNKAEQTVTLLNKVRAHYEKPVPVAGAAKPKKSVRTPKASTAKNALANTQRSNTQGSKTATSKTKQATKRKPATQKTGQAKN